jgi:ABC-2 type transport system permease protein
MKLWATIKKDLRILLRDKVGIAIIFVMPIILVIVVTGIQNNTFELLNKNKIALAVCNKDTGTAARQFIQAIDKIGMFQIIPIAAGNSEAGIIDRMRAAKTLVGVVLPEDFSRQIALKAKITTAKALSSFGLSGEPANVAARDGNSPVILFCAPILQESYRRSIQGSLYSALQMVESSQVLKTLYATINEKSLPDSLEQDMLGSSVKIKEESLSSGDNRITPNASQHNVPAWTIFAMFFIVISLGGSVVQEKLNGSFARLKTLPTNYYTALLSKQITYLGVTVLQAIIIFAIGICLFPFIGLPELRLPSDIVALVLVTLVCGWCAVSYAICVGVFANTREQANAFGAISIVILAMIGGLMVPAFAMPGSFHTIMKISPLHWCLEAYYALFLEGGNLRDVLANVIPLLFITGAIQLFIFIGLKRKNLI